MKLRLFLYIVVFLLMLVICIRISGVVSDTVTEFKKVWGYEQRTENPNAMISNEDFDHFFESNLKNTEPVSTKPIADNPEHKKSNIPCSNSSNINTVVDFSSSPFQDFVCVDENGTEHHVMAVGNPKPPGMVNVPPSINNVPSTIVINAGANPNQ